MQNIVANTDDQLTHALIESKHSNILSKEIDKKGKFKEINEYISEKDGIIDLHEYDTFLCEISKVNLGKLLNNKKELLETMDIINDSLLKMFRHRKPNIEQLDTVIKYYLNNPYNKYLPIFDDLVKNQYVFHACHIKQFEQLGYKDCNYNVHIDNDFMKLLTNDFEEELIKVVKNVEIINVNQVCYYINCIKDANQFFEHKVQINHLKILLKKCSVDNRIYEYLINANFQYMITPELF